MVKLPKEDKDASSQARIVMFTLDNYHLLVHHRPATLVELEQLAEVAANYLRMFYMYPNVPNFRQYVMNRLRQLFNLEFKMRCAECGTAHHQDEITAPER